MKHRRINATLKRVLPPRALPPIAALALTALLILTTLPLAGTAAPRLEQQPLESLIALNSTEATERGAPLNAFSVPSVASMVQSPGTTTTADAQNVELVGQIGGGSYAIAVHGNYAYMGVGPRLVVLDVSDPANPTVVGQTAVLPAGVSAVYVAGGYAYVPFRYADLRVIDVSDPTAPVVVGTVPVWARDVHVADNYAYVSGGDLRVVDVSNPTAPVVVGYYNTPGYAVGVYVAGNYAYVVSESEGLRVVDVSDPTAPVEVGYYNTPGRARNVYVAGNYAYIAADQSGLRVVDVSDPTAPVEVGVCDTGSWYATGVYVAGSYAYVSGGSLRVVDVSDPTAPVEVDAYNAWGARDVYVTGGYAYLASDWPLSLTVIDVSDPTAPVEVGFYDTTRYAGDVHVTGGYAYVVSWNAGLRVIDVSDPTAPVEVGHYGTPGTSGHAQRVYVTGGYAYVADGSYGLRIVDVSDPAAPVEVGACDTPGRRYVRGVYVAGNYAYVAVDGYGENLLIVDVSNPATPVEVGVGYYSPAGAVDVYVTGGYAYVTTRYSLWVVDVSDPTAPVAVGHCDTGSRAGDVYVAGNYAYVAAGWQSEGLWVVDVSDPTAPVAVGYWSTSVDGYGVYVAGNYAYVAAGQSGLRVVDVSDPTAPVEVGYFSTPANAHGVYMAGSYAYVAALTSGLFILHYTGEPGPTYSISGQVTDADGNPISDVTLSDGAGHTATTDSNGNYTISDLSAGTYTLTPSKSSYTFAPASRTVSVPPSATGQDFTGTPTPPPPLDKAPVVLVHGWQGLGDRTFRCSEGISRPGPQVTNTFGDMAAWLQDDGFDVWIAHLDTGPGGTPLLENNAWGPGCLKDQIVYVKQETGAPQVILIAHSMGGLVSRAYSEGPEYQSDVQALITLGSPHAGIPSNWLKFLVGPMNLPSVCKGHEALCQMTEERMEKWNQDHGRITETSPFYYFIGGDKSDSILGTMLRFWADPNDGCVGTRTAQALKDGSSAIQSDPQGRYQTHETHSEGLGYPSYFQPPFLDPTGQLRSQSYECIQNVLLGASNPCTELGSAALSAPAALAAPSLTGYTSDVFGHLNTGEMAEHTLQVDADGASLFYLSWVTGTLGITLTNPVGTVIDPAYAAANTDVVTYTTSPGSEMTPPFAAYAFTTTVPGLYTATITAGDVGITGTDYLLFAAMETTRTLSVALDSDHYQIGDTAVLTATLEGDGGGITGATVQATFSRSDAITDTLTLTDQGDGAYRGTYAIPNVPGYLHLRVTAEGSDAGTQFNRQVDRLLTVASQAVQLTGIYADRADDADGNGRYETLTVDVEVLAAGDGDFTFSADLVVGGDQFVAHVITQTALITGTQTVPLRFDGDLIHEGGSDGPFTVTNLLISDLQNAGIPSVMADDVWTTAAYDHTQFGRITGDLDGNCVVNIVDIMLVASRWDASIGDIRYNATYDQDGDGNIDIADIMLVAAHWREKCE